MQVLLVDKKIKIFIPLLFVLSILLPLTEVGVMAQAK
jgi:hypothetical protein